MEASHEELTAVMMRLAPFTPLGHRTVMVTRKWDPEIQAYHAVEGLIFMEPTAEMISGNEQMEARIQHLEQMSTKMSSLYNPGDKLTIH